MAEEDSLISGIRDDTEATSVSVSSSSPSPSLSLSLSPSPSPSPSPSLSSSPKTSKQKIKLRCSHGGKIMVRPPNGHLKYIGGETRLVAIPRDITFSELMKKLSDIADGEIILKYQLVPEELDTLVSVRNDEDLKHMLEEYDRQERIGGNMPKMRAYLFPSKPAVLESGPSLSSVALEQRYIDAINGIIRATPPRHLMISPLSCRPSFSISSPGTSPKVISPDKVLNPWEASSPKSQLSMHRVQSSPSLYYWGENQQQQGSGSRQQVMYHQAYRHQNQPHGHLYVQQQQQHGGLYSMNSLQPQDFYRGVGRPGAMDRFYPAGGRAQKGVYDEGSSG